MWPLKGNFCRNKQGAWGGGFAIKCYNFVLEFYQITEIIGTQGGLIEFVINDNYNYSFHWLDETSAVTFRLHQLREGGSLGSQPVTLRYTKSSRGRKSLPWVHMVYAGLIWRAATLAAWREVWWSDSNTTLLGITVIYCRILYKYGTLR